jgi:hypothetical protein
MKFAFFTKYYCGDKIEEDEMDGTFGTYKNIRNTHNILAIEPEENREINIGIYGIKINIKKLVGRVWTGFISFGIEASDSNEPSGYIKWG